MLLLNIRTNTDSALQNPEPTKNAFAQDIIIFFISLFFIPTNAIRNQTITFNCLVKKYIRFKHQG